MKIDLHTHTYYSGDAVQTPEKLVKAAKKKGLDGIATTDHDTVKAWKRALAAGKKHKVSVIKGEEIHVYYNEKKIGEVIGLFLNEFVQPGEFLEVKDKIKAQGGLMVAAHPFDYLRNRFKMIKEYKKYFDAIEVFNSRVVFLRFNKKAYQFAKENNLALSAGSDCHCSYEVGNAYVKFEGNKTEDLIKAFKNRKTTVEGKRTNPLIHALSTIAKLKVFEPEDGD